MRDDEGPAKNLPLKRQRNAQQDTKTQWSLLVYFDSAAKVVREKLGRFSSSFAEITNEKELGKRIQQRQNSLPIPNITHI